MRAGRDHAGRHDDALGGGTRLRHQRRSQHHPADRTADRRAGGRQHHHLLHPVRQERPGPRHHGRPVQGQQRREPGPDRRGRPHGHRPAQGTAGGRQWRQRRQCARSAAGPADGAPGHGQDDVGRPVDGGGQQRRHDRRRHDPAAGLGHLRGPAHGQLLHGHGDGKHRRHGQVQRRHDVDRSRGQLRRGCRNWSRHAADSG
ncbi:hypothetical protein D3C86_1531960 [compost metagenome]